MFKKTVEFKQWIVRDTLVQSLTIVFKKSYEMFNSASGISVHHYSRVLSSPCPFAYRSDPFPQIVNQLSFHVDRKV